jgi:predicted alpha/beta-fold hydrolase
MAEVLQEKTDQFVPRRGLRNGHAQTLAGNFMRRENLLPPGEARLFDVEKDVQILCDCHWQPERASRLTLLILHGLEGSIDSNYVIGTGSKAWALGWNVVRMNVRNCGGTDAVQLRVVERRSIGDADLDGTGTVATYRAGWLFHGR